jgi:glycosyltransferase involved in cell wall biosynthesis
LKRCGDSWQFLSSADLILVEYGQYYRLLELLPLLAGGKPRILFDYHGITPAELWETHSREALEMGSRQRGLIWCTDAGLVHSRFTWQELHGPTGFPAERLSILEHPIDTKRFCPGRPQRSLQDRLGLRDVSLILFVGRLAPNKRVPVLIEALDQLRDLLPAVHLILVGDDTDVYQVEARRCRQRAADLGLADRVHFLGQVREEHLLDAYRSADLFVMPSRHEGFCIPVIEAMACGLPVVAARAGALPETVAGAGLTFSPDDSADLARQVRRIFQSGKTRQGDKETRRQGDTRPFASPLPVSVSPSQLKVAIVSIRYGSDFVGGAETSLRSIATALHEAGCAVEIFTTCARSDRDWANCLPEGTSVGHVSNVPPPASAMPVHRFRVDAYEPARQREAISAILQADGFPEAETERHYLDHSIRSTRLLEALRQRIEQFDAVIVGPYLYGLAFDIATAFPDKTLLLPCFHDEAFARLRIWREAYREVGGILYHSAEEKDLAERLLGLNHAGGVCLGTFVDTQTQGNAEQGRLLVGKGPPYIVYCGRYLREKNLPLLLDYTRRYHEASPDRFMFVFVGDGEVPIPREPWARNLGFVEESCKRDILAGAAALAQLSRNESLSLAALEAWAQGVPVLAAVDCAVLAGHLRRCGGGRAVDDYASFAAALDDLRQRPATWQRLGQQGREYVRTVYGSRAGFVRRLLESIRDLTVPLAQRMQRQGLLRAAEHERSVWRERFGQLVEELLHNPSRQKREQLEVRPRTQERVVSAGSETALIPVHVVNQGTHGVLSEGPGRVLLRSVVLDELGQSSGLPVRDTPLPGLLIPGQEAAAALRVSVPATAGAYQVACFAVFPHAENEAPESRLRLIVEPASVQTEDRCCAAPLKAVHSALVEAETKKQLPADYLDVTQGFLAKWKSWIKRKLLGNFKRAYVDVLSRQQSAFNRQALTALRELSECCALLDHALATGNPRKDSPAAYGLAFTPLEADREISSLVSLIQRSVADGQTTELALLLRQLLAQLGEAQRRCSALEARLDRLEKTERVQS